jgi:4-amino-4-deoxy-L-arabinose transferase-like glycosyltransferase
MSELPPATDSRPAVKGWIPRPFHIIVALLVAAGFFVFRLSRDLPMTPDECLVGQTAREMDLANDWLCPRFSGEARLARPPMAYWTAGLSWRLTGRLDALSLRLVSAIAGLGCVVAVWSLARTMFGKRTAFVTGVIFASAAGTLHYTHNGAVDLQLTFWCLLGVLAFERGLRALSRTRRRVWLAMFYACLGIAMLSAMPIPLFVVLPGLLAYLFVTRRMSEVPRLFLLPGLLISGATFGWWVITLGRSPSVGFDSLWLMWHYRLLPWVSGGLRAGVENRPYYPLAILAAMVLPWTLSLPEAAIAPYLKRYADVRRGLWLPWCLLATNLIIFTLARFKQPEFMLPSLPWAALLLGVVVERLFFRTADREELGPRNLLLLAAVLVFGFGVAAGELIGWFGDPPWPVLLRTVLVLWMTGTGLLIALAAFGVRYFRASFVTVAVTGALAVTIARGVVVPLTMASPNYFGFAEGLRQAVSIPAADDLQWLCRPDPRLVFHTNHACRGVIGELELARRVRKTREAGAPTGIEPIVGDIVLRRLKSKEPFFAVGEANWLETWSARPEYAQSAHTIYRYPSFDGDPDHDLVVFTNDAGTAYVRREGKRLIRFAGAPETRSAETRPRQASSTSTRPPQ